MARPLWTDAGDDPRDIAAFLENAAQEAGRLDFAPRELPRDTDLALLHQAAILRARTQLAERHSEKDRVLAQEVKAIDELVRSANLLVERLREWYALHAPEATRLVTEHRDLARLVAEHGDRGAVMQALDQADTASVGTDLDAGDLAAVQGLAEALRAVHEAWRRIEDRVEALMGEIAPNLLSVVGPVLGARLIAQAGSLVQLASVPAGTLQTYGAETALFRHIKEGTKPPKHGILFQHPKVHAAPPWQRGAVARALSLHAGLAAKADAFTQNDLRDTLLAGLEDDLSRIARTKAKPPKRGGRGGQRFDQGPRGKPGRGAKKGDAAGRRRGGQGGSGPRGKARKSGPRDAGKRQKDPGAFRRGGPAKPPGGRG